MALILPPLIQLKQVSLVSADVRYFAPVDVTANAPTISPSINSLTAFSDICSFLLHNGPKPDQDKTPALVEQRTCYLLSRQHGNHDRCKIISAVHILRLAE
jgi:hypothetical protein